MRISAWAFVLAIVVLGFVAPRASVLVAQQTERHPSTVTAKRRRVAQIMEEAIKQGQSAVQGIHIFTRVPPSSEEIAELRELGPDAISVLAEYLSSGSPQKQLLAVEFLGRIGGSAVIPPLDFVLRTSPSAPLREITLRWLPLEKNEAVRQILVRTVKTDKNSAVRDLAQQRLADYAGK